MLWIKKATKLHIAAVDRIFDGCVIANLSVRRIPTPAPVIVNKTKPTVVRTWTIHRGFGWNLIITSVLTYSSPLNMKKAKVFPTNPDICQLFVTAVSGEIIETIDNCPPEPSPKLSQSFCLSWSGRCTRPENSPAEEKRISWEPTKTQFLYWLQMCVQCTHTLYAVLTNGNWKVRTGESLTSLSTPEHRPACPNDGRRGVEEVGAGD